MHFSYDVCSCNSSFTLVSAFINIFSLLIAFFGGMKSHTFSNVPAFIN